MEITRQLREYAAEKGVEDLQQAQRRGLEDQSIAFREGGGKIYHED